MHNWTIDYEDGFIKQISQLAIETQDKIQKKISNVAIFDDPAKPDLTWIVAVMMTVLTLSRFIQVWPLNLPMKWIPTTEC